MIDLNRKSEKNQQEELSTEVIVGTVIVVCAWMIWAFLIGGML